MESGPDNYREWRGKGKQQTTDHKQQTDCEASAGKPTTHNSEPKTENNKQQTTNNKQQTDYEASAGKPPTDNSELTTHNREPQTTNHKQQTSFDLIYFDGHHTKEATLKYFELLLPTAHNDSVFVFDDIHWSRGMEEAWDIIKKHPEVRVSIDTFHLGLIFFRKEQVKQDFIIRL
ncbi:MAG: class I SAM-dependent methyltransferase [Salegentibacter sp.]|nr:class I SAM-dependent methyltransferase [Salegentibacter sp.]MDR9458281.1 class I SAM-dependent methyltransferase [Salegentibacter sp.]